MQTTSAGLLMVRKHQKELQFFLVHPGGPFYKNKNESVWSIPKGIPEKDERLETAAQREFYEETGIMALSPFYSLDSVKLKSGKIIYAWMFYGDWDATHGIVSNTFLLEWPPRSGKKIEIPEVDRAAWMNYDLATRMIHPNQIPFLQRAVDLQIL